MKHSALLFGITLSFLSIHGFSAETSYVSVEYRHRPPEMLVDGENFSGPLVEITRKMVASVNKRLVERSNQFKNSLRLVEVSRLTLLPRTFCTRKRLIKVDYLGPLGYQRKVIRFLVRKGKEKTISRYEDLANFKIGVKKGTAYFKKFDDDAAINKIASNDDLNMVKMFEFGRFDSMIAVDIPALEQALEKRNFKDYAFAEYNYPKLIWNYYAIPIASKHKKELQAALEQMVTSGEVANIYRKFDIPPPIHDGNIKFPRCQDIL